MCVRESVCVRESESTFKLSVLLLFCYTSYLFAASFFVFANSVGNMLLAARNSDFLSFLHSSFHRVVQARVYLKAPETLRRSCDSSRASFTPGAAAAPGTTAPSSAAPHKQRAAAASEGRRRVRMAATLRMAAVVAEALAATSGPSPAAPCTPTAPRNHIQTSATGGRSSTITPSPLLQFTQT